MAERDIDVVRDQFDAVNERDWGRASDHYADDVVLVIEEGFLNRGTFVGKEAVGEWFGDWFRNFAKDYRVRITEARELGPGLVYVFAKHGGTGRTSGAEVRGEYAYLYRVVDGKVARAQLFETQENALEAGALPEWSGAQTD